MVRHLILDQDDVGSNPTPRAIREEYDAWEEEFGTRTANILVNFSCFNYRHLNKERFNIWIKILDTRQNVV